MTKALTVALFVIEKYTETIGMPQIRELVKETMEL